MTKGFKGREYTIYNKLGYEDRYHYFWTLSETFNIEIMQIILKAEELGPEQDFDELLNWLQEQKYGTIQ